MDGKVVLGKTGCCFISWEQSRCRKGIYRRELNIPWNYKRNTQPLHHAIGPEHTQGLTDLPDCQPALISMSTDSHPLVNIHTNQHACPPISCTGPSELTGPDELVRPDQRTYCGQLVGPGQLTDRLVRHIDGLRLVSLLSLTCDHALFLLIQYSHITPPYILYFIYIPLSSTGSLFFPLWIPC